MATIEEHIAIRVDDEEIEGTFVTPGTLVPGVLFVHGWGGSQQQYLARAREVAGLGTICLTFDLRGHARTIREFETVTRAQNFTDLLAAYDRLVQRPHVDPNAIALVGSSYGGYLAAILTSMRPVKWLALRAPALYIDANWDSPKLRLHEGTELKTYRHTVVPYEQNRALRACHEFEGDMLLIESEHDDIIPPQVLKSYREATRSSHSTTYRVLTGADHGLTGEADQQAYSKVLVGWLKEMVAGARSSKPVAPAADTSAPPEAPPKNVEPAAAAAAA